MKYLLTFLMFHFYILNTHAQKNDNVLFFSHAGNTTSQIEFDLDPPFITLGETISFLSTNATYCDDEGNLLFYTNGLQVYNYFNEMVENGDSINTGYYADNSIGYGYTILNGAFFLKHPGDSSKYFLYHMFAEPLPQFSTFMLSLYCTKIDASANNGHGKVVEKNVPLLEAHEQFNFNHAAAVRHANGRDWWIMLPHRMQPKYYRFLLSPEGISGPSEQEVGFKVPTSDPHEYYGVSLFSQDGSRYVDYEWKNGEGFQVYDFDRCTGLLSNPKKVGYDPGTATVNGALGIALSKSGRFVYMAHTKDQGTRLIQYDLNSMDIAGSAVLVSECPVPVSPFECSLAFPFLAPNGKIYVTALIDTVAFHIIHEPDSGGLACDFEFGGFVFPESFPYGVPPYFPNYRLLDLPGSSCDTLGIDGPVAVGEVEKEGAIISLYPNPAGKEIYLKLEKSIGKKATLQLYTVTGQLVRNWGIIAEQQGQGFSMEGLTPGLYFWSAVSDDTVIESGKLVVE